MECPICGHRLGENDAFCPNCGNFSLPMQDGSRPVPTVSTPPGTPVEGSAWVPPPEEFLEDTPVNPPHKVAERLYPPPETEIDEVPPTTEKDPPAPERPVPVRPRRSAGKGWRVAAIAACCIAVLAVAFSAYIIRTTSSLRVQLNKAQKESSSAQANAASLESQVDALSQELDSIKAENLTLGSQVAQLQSDINQMETSVNQNQYDKETALNQLNEATSELSSVSEERDALQSQLEDAQSALEDAQSENAALTEENSSLKSDLEAVKTRAEFYDTYVVFVMTGSLNRYYHKYDCPDFTRRSFVAYSPKLAEANGYSPCPTCIGGAASPSPDEE